MKLRLSFKNHIWFAEVQSGGQDFVEGTKLEKLLGEMFQRVKQSIITTADTEDEVPRAIDVSVQINIWDDDGNVREDHTPRGLFDLMPDSQRAAIRKAKKGGANNGHS